MFNDFGCKFSNFRTKESGPVGSDIKLRNIQELNLRALTVSWHGLGALRIKLKQNVLKLMDMESKYFLKY